MLARIHPPMAGCGSKTLNPHQIPTRILWIFRNKRTYLKTRITVVQD